MTGERSSQVAEWRQEIFFRARRGPWKMWHWAAGRLLDSHLDSHFGIVSSERRGTTELGLVSPDFVQYQPVSYPDMREILRRLEISTDDVFLDYGSGMGRAICLAAMYPFRSVLGLEISAELCEIARTNVHRIQNKLRCKNVEIIQANAVEYVVPANVSIVFLFNPFGGATLARVLDNIGQSVRRSQRKVQVIFYGTVSSMGFRREASKRSWLKLNSEMQLKTGAVALHYAAGVSFDRVNT
jgi:precorrin-6B methylase 2